MNSSFWELGGGGGGGGIPHSPHFGRLEVWLIVPCIAVYRKCHASVRPPDVVLHRNFTRPSTA